MRRAVPYFLLFLPALTTVAAVWLPEAALAGGVKRRLTIRSNPPGAKVYVDGYEIGKTPVSTYFTYYGTREIRLVKEGCETLVHYAQLKPPWFQLPGLDFISDNFIPGEIDDPHVLSYRLQPRRLVPRDELMENANRFRTSVLSEAVVSPPPSGPMMPPPGGGAVSPYDPPGGWQGPVSGSPSGGGLPPGTVDPFLAVPRQSPPPPYNGGATPTPAPPADGGPTTPPGGWVPSDPGAARSSGGDPASYFPRPLEVTTPGNGQGDGTSDRSSPARAVRGPWSWETQPPSSASPSPSRPPTASPQSMPFNPPRNAAPSSYPFRSPQRP